MSFFEYFLRAFIPMFVAVDIIGVIPFFIGLTDGMPEKTRRKLIGQSVLTAILVSFVFIFVGKALFAFLKISIADFMIAGGAVIFIISSHDLISQEKTSVTPDITLGVVPLGTPLLAGPAVLATAIITLGRPHGIPVTLLAVFCNFILAGIAFFYSKYIIKILGRSGSRALSKIMALVMCAYGIMMIREGVVEIILNVAKMK